MSKPDLEQVAMRNVRSFTFFRVFFTARFYYPVYTLIFLDHGLTLEQFGILNAIWAATIVLAEVPSGALADTIGRRNLLITTGVLMVLEMGVLLLAPIDGGAWLFTLFLINRVLSGLAEAAASGADEALAYDSLRAAGKESRWGHVLERVQRDTSLAFFFAMMTGAAVYDPQMVNALFTFLGIGFYVEQSQLVKLPILLTLLSGLVVLTMALRMHEPCAHETRGARETLAQSWRQTLSAARWIWITSAPFGILLAAMALDNVIRQFLTLASEYWNVIQLPIASFGLIGSGMALLGLFVPKMSRIMAEQMTPVRNFIITASVVLLGLTGLAFAIPYWGILPAVLLYVGMGMTNFFVSRYLNEVAPSEQRATVLSFKGLSTNFAYGSVSILYALLIKGIKSKDEIALIEDAEVLQETVFIESLGWFPGYFAGTVLAVFLIHRLRFRKRG
jgi:MFS family permease